MKNKKIIIGIVLFLTIISVTYYIYKDNNTSISILKENNNIPNTIAVYIKDENGNYQESEQIPQEGYQLNNEKSTCSNGVIPGWDTKNHRFYTDNLVKSGTSCYLYFDKHVPTGSEIILANVTVNENTPDFSQVATTDEGVFKAEDGMYGGTTYYWRGAVTTNYIKFAGFCWRIIRINGDGSLRLIYDGTTCHANGTSTAESIAKTSQAYNLSYDRSEYVGWTHSTGSQRTTGGSASNIKIQTETWYGNNITGTNVEKVADGKFCNDRNTQSGYSWSSQPSSDFYYAAYKRINTDYVPSLECYTSDAYELNVGLITVDEVMYAGGTKANNLYYLYNGQDYWTMSPSLWNSGASFAYVFLVNSAGSPGSTSVYQTYIGLRPVINLRSDVTFSSGNGTLNNPYIVAD